MAVAVGTAWEDSRRSGLETGAGEITVKLGTADLGAGEVEAVSVVESVELSGVPEAFRGAGEVTAVGGTAELGAGEAEAGSAVESVGVSGVVVETGAAEASWGTVGTAVEVGCDSCPGGTVVGTEASGEETPLLPAAGTACVSGNDSEGVVPAVGIEFPPGDKAAGVPLTGVEEAPGVGISTGGFCCAGLGPGLADRWIR
jgi:hypothetical protein